MSLRKTFREDNIHEIPRAKSPNANRYGMTNNIFIEIAPPRTTSRPIRMIMPIRWLIIAADRVTIGRISEGKTIFLIKLDYSNTELGQRFITSAKNNQGRRPAISQ